mmetsp:Transcript_129146/g.306453  ORF Transcript_129146/g.306453 Transcript_129146/m.306453 type:complete len:372 (-) Transcript_129146:72-1187(-)|eukprot:CAMPEP_0181494784 /NCGR_PEP_ID=MMETSP1110-20121109/51990_1 /TAXON_ID=174948 /ORGANISM="Symbiodinium sp., Strain CCMP421" /LENGTH=371 /DNA_ID=CAMNT_0023622287 /DNA_START=146 /DNA_END=1261 /DNA_ORIENTATION=-
MSFRLLSGISGWFDSASEEANGYAPVKNTFIHYESEEQPDYRPARSGPARFQETLPQMRQEGSSSADPIPEEGVGSPVISLASQSTSMFLESQPVEAPVKNTFIHFDDQQPDYMTTISGPAILASAKEAPGPLAALAEETSEAEVLPSKGSAGHATGTCKPCAHNWKAAGCSKASECTFCHLCEADDFHRRRKEKTQRLKAERNKRKGDKEEAAQAPVQPGPMREASAAALAPVVAASGPAPGELLINHAPSSALIRWCVDLRRLCSQYRYGLSRRFVVRFAQEVPFVLFLNPAKPQAAAAFSTNDLSATMQVKCTEPSFAPRMQLSFQVEGQQVHAVQEHNFQAEPFCSSQGVWQLSDMQAVLRVELRVL